jgi:hypothetical protein
VHALTGSRTSSKVAKLSLLAVGAEAASVIVNVCGALTSTPPFAVPPSSCSRTVTRVLPVAPPRGV